MMYDYLSMLEQCLCVRLGCEREHQQHMPSTEFIDSRSCPHLCQCLKS